ncbi:MAG: hypothetical protein GWP09_02320 [Nitrospiraceae bacterium]|nr:hypothetical protein [Nitrospiraceae bacterium]
MKISLFNIVIQQDKFEINKRFRKVAYDNILDDKDDLSLEKYLKERDYKSFIDKLKINILLSGLPKTAYGMRRLSRFLINEMYKVTDDNVSGEHLFDGDHRGKEGRKNIIGERDNYDKILSFKLIKEKLMDFKKGFETYIRNSGEGSEEFKIYRSIETCGLPRTTKGKRNLYDLIKDTELTADDIYDAYKKNKMENNEFERIRKNVREKLGLDIYDN